MIFPLHLLSSESVDEMFDLRRLILRPRDGDDVKTNRERELPLSEKPKGKPFDLSLFGKINRKRRVKPMIRTTCFHLDNNEHVFVSCNDVKLAVIIGDVFFENFVASFS